VQWKAEYPEKLCVVMAAILKRLAALLNVVLSVTAATSRTQKIDPTKPAWLNLAIMANRQPRSKLVQTLVSEYHHVVTIKNLLPDVPHISSLVGKHLERPLFYGEFSIPKGSTILKLRQPIGGDNGTHKLVIGIFHTPDQCLDKSFKVIHPFVHPACTRDVLSRALFETLVTGPSALAEKRTATLNYYAELARKLALSSFSTSRSSCFILLAIVLCLRRLSLDPQHLLRKELRP
jgi:hypothetical protein